MKACLCSREAAGSDKRPSVSCFDGLTYGTGGILNAPQGVGAESTGVFLPAVNKHTSLFNAAAGVPALFINAALLHVQ